MTFNEIRLIKTERHDDRKTKIHKYEKTIKRIQNGSSRVPMNYDVKLRINQGRKTKRKKDKKTNNMRTQKTTSN